MELEWEVVFITKDLNRCLRNVHLQSVCVCVCVYVCVCTPMTSTHVHSTIVVNKKNHA